jgi:lipid II:glycine glycyltransferase (peptidoglycan interpeptide bridge formation enzyme)
LNPAARTNEERAVMEAMADFFAKSGAAMISVGLTKAINDCLPFFWRGFKVIPRYTYQIDLRLSEAEVLAAMSVERRNDIRKAERDRISVYEASGTKEIRSLVMETHSRKSKGLRLNEMESILLTFPPGLGSFCLLAEGKTGVQSGVFVVHDNESAFYLLGGYSKGAHHGAGALAMFRAIQKAKEMGLQVFDFEGSVIPPIEKYFRGFGGRLTPVFSVHKAWLPVEVGLKLIRRPLF